MSIVEQIEIANPNNQLKLYGYEDYFNKFINLYENKSLPNVILLSGSKGIGKSTFAYHYINYLLSRGESNPYSINNFKINNTNNSFYLMQNNIHPNFFLLDSIDDSENIKIEQTRNLLKYLNKTTYLKDIKIILIDNAEKLNLNSSNALLKALEESLYNTYFLIICNDLANFADTIKSRCINFNINFSIDKKINIFNKIMEDYDFDLKGVDKNRFLEFETPGNLLKYINILKDFNINDKKSNFSYIEYLLNLYKLNKKSELLKFISILIENFYNELSIKNGSNISKYYKNKNKILYLINDMTRFNLDKKNLLFHVEDILKNER